MLPWSVPVSVKGILPHREPSGEILPAGSERGRESAVMLPHALRNPREKLKVRLTIAEQARVPEPLSAASRLLCRVPFPFIPRESETGPGREKERSGGNPRAPLTRAPLTSPHIQHRPAISHLFLRLSLTAPGRVRSEAPRITHASGEPRSPASPPPSPCPREPPHSRLPWLLRESGAPSGVLSPVPREAPGEHGWQERSRERREIPRAFQPRLIPSLPSPLSCLLSAISMTPPGECPRHPSP